MNKAYETKCAKVWNQAYERAIGVSLPDPSAYATGIMREWIRSNPESSFTGSLKAKRGAA